MTTTTDVQAKKAAKLVQTDGTADDYVSCAAHVPGWEDLSDNDRSELVDRMRGFWTLKAPPQVRISSDESGKCTVGPDDSDNTTLYALRLSGAMASRSMAYIDERLADLATYHKRSNRRGATSTNMESSVAFVAGAKPQDTVQSSLAVQMAATHDAAMRALGMIGTSEFTEQAKLYGNLATKLLNAYTRQAETLAKLQRGGEQVIKHVHIDNRGGQAVVTDQLVTGGHDERMQGQAHEQGARGPSLLGHDPQGNGVPISSDAGKEAVQASWGAVSGRA